MSVDDPLREALRLWAIEVLDALRSDPEPVTTRDQASKWACDSDGVFRKRSRTARVWSTKVLERSRSSPAWQDVLVAMAAQPEVHRQLETLIGTCLGASRFEPWSIGVGMLPQPGEVDNFERHFNEQWAKLDRFFTANDRAFTAIWPIASTQFPLETHVSLSRDIELASMTDEAPAMALNLGIVDQFFRGHDLLLPDWNERACMRYQLSLPKLVGDELSEGGEQPQEIHEHLESLRLRIDMALGLVIDAPRATCGQFMLDAPGDWPHGGGVHFRVVPPPQAWRHFAIEPTTDELGSLPIDLAKPGKSGRERNRSRARVGDRATRLPAAQRTA